MEIRPLIPADEAAMLELLTNESIAQTYMLPDFETKADAIPLFRRILARSQDNCHFERGICADGVLKAASAELFRLGYREVVTGAFAENAASLRVMEKAGMIPLARTDTIEYRGQNHLCVYRSISASQ